MDEVDHKFIDGELDYVETLQACAQNSLNNKRYLELIYHLQDLTDFVERLKRFVQATLN